MIAVAMLSLAGIPPFPGFIAKFLIFRNVIAAGYTPTRCWAWSAATSASISTCAWIQYMFMSAPSEDIRRRARCFARSRARCGPALPRAGHPSVRVSRLVHRTPVSGPRTHARVFVAGAAAIDQLAHRNAVKQFDVPPLHLDQPVVMKAGKQAAHGFQLEPQVAPDLLARHPQHELARRIAVRAGTAATSRAGTPRAAARRSSFPARSSWCCARAHLLRQQLDAGCAGIGR